MLDDFNRMYWNLHNILKLFVLIWILWCGRLMNALEQNFDLKSVLNDWKTYAYKFNNVYTYGRWDMDERNILRKLIFAMV